MNKNFFTCDNLSGDYPALQNDVRLGTPTAVFGLSDSQKYLTAGLFDGVVLYIAPDHIAAEKAFESLKTLSGKRCAYLSPKDDVLLYKDAVSRDALFRRLTALWKWQAGAEVLVCDVEAVCQLVPKKLAVFSLETGKETEMRALVESLAAAGYVRDAAPESKGTFAVRGDVLDIYPVNCEHPVRIDFFGDEVESIKPYDEITGERYPKLSRIDIVAATDAS